MPLDRLVATCLTSSCYGLHEMGPDAPDLRAVSAVNLAREWAAKGELERAEDVITQALDVGTEFGEALALAGWIYLHQKRYAEAEEAYRSALVAGFDTPETREGHLVAAQAVGG